MKKEFTLRLDDAACAELENLKKLSGEKTDAKAIRFAIQYVTNKHDFDYFIQPWKDEFLRMPFDVTKRKKWADYVAECHATGKEIDYDNYDWDK